MTEIQSFLEERWQSGRGTGSTLCDPTSERPIATARTEGLDLAGALSAARERGGPALRALSFAERGELLRALSAALRDAREELLDLSVASCGTTRSDAKFDVDGAIFTLAAYAELGAGLGARRFLVEGEGERLTRSPRFLGYHIRVPKRGVAVHINAFNFPAWGMAEKAAVALLAGVPVVTKPATSTALLAHRLMRVVAECGALPESSWQFVGGAAGDLLDHLGGQDVVAFTGSAATANWLRRTPSIVEHSVRLNVEADSLNAALLLPAVHDDTYQMFLRDVVKEMTQKSGQKCTATRRILVPEDDLERVEGDLRERLAAIKVGDPRRDDVQVGPLATRAQLEDARAGIGELVESGARIVFGDPERVEALGVEPGQGCFLGPVLLRADAPHDVPAVHAREVFAPVATLMGYRTADEAAALVALGGGGLLCSIYSDDGSLTGELIESLAPFSGRLFIGGAKVADLAPTPGTVLPSCVHGGPGRAGGGEELGGLRGLDLYTQRTAIQGDRGVLDRLLGLR